jgi:hypothetical protein
MVPDLPANRVIGRRYLREQSGPDRTWLDGDEAEWDILEVAVNFGDQRVKPVRHLLRTAPIRGRRCPTAKPGADP